jgi:hypothetical protein
MVIIVVISLSVTGDVASLKDIFECMGRGGWGGNWSKWHDFLIRKNI